MLLPEWIETVLKQSFSEGITSDDQSKNASIYIAANIWPQAAQVLKESLGFDLLVSIAGVDWKNFFEVVYHLESVEKKQLLAVKIKLDHDSPQVQSVADVWPAADWHEREAFDLLGIVFEGHPHLKRILLPEDWEGFPLRKDYETSAAWHGIPEKHPFKGKTPVNYDPLKKGLR